MHLKENGLPYAGWEATLCPGGEIGKHSRLGIFQCLHFADSNSAQDTKNNSIRVTQLSMVIFVLLVFGSKVVFLLIE